jgi:murein biosynthesis integral membrane protein MurJ
MTEPAREAGPGIARRAGLVAVGTMLSRISGAVRDAVIAATFTLVATDTFWLAFTIPNALRVILGEGAVSAAIVPVYTEARTKEGDDEARRVFARLAGAMSLLLLIVSVIGVFAAPVVVTLYASGFHETPGLFEETVLLTRIVFPYILLVGLGALAQGGLNANGRFFAPAFAPALLNFALALAPVLVLPIVTANGAPASVALAIAALVGGVLSLAFVLPELSRAGASRATDARAPRSVRAPRVPAARPAGDRPRRVPGERRGLAAVLFVPPARCVELPLLRAAARGDPAGHVRPRDRVRDAASDRERGVTR